MACSSTSLGLCVNNLAKGIVLVDSERYYDELHFPFSRFEKQARGLVEIADGREHLLKPQIEWAYIMNFDEGVFETYSGLNGIRVKNARGRYSSLFMPETPHIPGVRLIHEMFLLNVNGESIRDYASDIDKITGGLINESEFKGMSFYEIDKIWKQRYAAEQAK